MSLSESCHVSFTSILRKQHIYLSPFVFWWFVIILVLYLVATAVWTTPEPAVACQGTAGVWGSAAQSPVIIVSWSSHANADRSSPVLFYKWREPQWFFFGLFSSNFFLIFFFSNHVFVRSSEKAFSQLDEGIEEKKAQGFPSQQHYQLWRVSTLSFYNTVYDTHTRVYSRKKKQHYQLELSVRTFLIYLSMVQWAV